MRKNPEELTEKKLVMLLGLKTIFFNQTTYVAIFGYNIGGFSV